MDLILQRNYVFKGNAFNVLYILKVLACPLYTQVCLDFVSVIQTSEKGVPEFQKIVLLFRHFLLFSQPFFGVPSPSFLSPPQKNPSK